MGKNHIWGVSLLASWPIFMILLGYMGSHYPDVVSMLPQVPGMEKMLFYALLLALLASLSITFNVLKKIAMYFTSVVAGCVCAEVLLNKVIWNYSCMQNTSVTVQALTWGTTYILCILVCGLLVVHFLWGQWSGYLGTFLASIAGGCYLSWAVNYASLIGHHSLWIEMGFCSFLNGLHAKTYERHSDKDKSNIILAIWSAASIAGFLWQLSEIRLHQDDGKNFIASDYEENKRDYEENLQAKIRVPKSNERQPNEPY